MLITCTYCEQSFCAQILFYCAESDPQNSLLSYVQATVTFTSVVCRLVVVQLLWHDISQHAVSAGCSSVTTAKELPCCRPLFYMDKPDSNTLACNVLYPAVLYVCKWCVCIFSMVVSLGDIINTQSYLSKSQMKVLQFQYNIMHINKKAKQTIKTATY